MTTDPAYQCAECNKTFDTSQKYASHASNTGHNVTGEGVTITPKLLTSAFGRLRFGRDTDGDGKLDIPRGELYKQLGVLAIGTIIGHTLAHDPSAAYQVITAAATLIWGGRAAASIRWLPLRPEWFDSQSLTHLGVGMLFGAGLVVLPWHRALDAVSHFMGSGHAPGAH